MHATVDGEPIWFESGDAQLRPSPEAFATPMLIPALEASRDLEVKASVDPTWLANLPSAVAVASEFWGFEPRAVHASGPRDPGPRRASSGLCFTCGVDSFYSLLIGASPDALVSVYGYDIDLDDVDRWAATERAVRAVGRDRGLPVFTVRSNLREHPTFDRTLWGLTHGGALAAIGHLLADEFGTLVISATYARIDERPWGSHPRLDPLWSAADLQVEHRGNELPRERKLRAIAGHPLVREHLRVCWVHLNDAANCGHCDKCLVTMVTLHALGELEFVATFEPCPVQELVRRVDDLPATVYRNLYPRILADGVPEPVAGAARRLIERSEAAARPG